VETSVALEGSAAVAEKNATTMTPTSYEEKAIEGGWKPLEEWEGNPEDWVDAKTFNQRGEYMDRIKSQSSLIKKLEKKQSLLEKDMQALAEHHRNVQEIERKRALDELKDLKRQALDLGDTVKVVDIDDKIDELKRSKAAPVTPQTATPEIHPEVTEWIEENTWYESDKIMTAAYNAILEDLINETPRLKNTPTKAMDMAKEMLQEEMPHKFKKRTSAVTDSSTNEGSKKAADISATRGLVKKLSDEQRRMAKRFVDMGALKSIEEYAKQLHDIGEI
jgi:hypothetical protein